MIAKQFVPRLVVSSFDPRYVVMWKRLRPTTTRRSAMMLTVKSHFALLVPMIVPIEHPSAYTKISPRLPRCSSTVRKTKYQMRIFTNVIPPLIIALPCETFLVHIAEIYISRMPTKNSMIYILIPFERTLRTSALWSVWSCTTRLFRPFKGEYRPPAVTTISSNRVCWRKT